MTHVELMAEIADLQARNMAQRQIIVRLLAYLAKSADDPEAVLKDFSEGGDQSVDQMNPQDDPQIHVAELIRREKDYLVAQARSLMRSE